MTGQPPAPEPYAALLELLAATGSLSDLDDAGYRRYCDLLEVALAGRVADEAARWRLVRELGRVGERTATIDLSLSLENAADPVLRSSAMARAAWGLGHLGRIEDASALVALLSSDAESVPAFAVELDWVRAILAYMSGDYDEMGARSRAMLARLPSLPPAAVLARFGRETPIVVHQTRVNLIISRIQLADREDGAAREVLLDEAARLLAEGESDPALPANLRALYDDNRGELLLRRDRAAALAHFNAAIARHSADPDARYALPDLRRHRAEVRAAEGDIVGAESDLLDALGEAVSYRHAHLEREIAADLFTIFSKRFPAGRRESELLDEYHLAGDSALGRLLQLWRSKDRRAAAGLPQRVATRALRLYRVLGDSLRATGMLELDLLEACGLLWKIGSLLQPWSVINRPRPLTALDRDIWERRAGEGARHLERLGFARAARVLGARAEGGAAVRRDSHAAVVSAAHAYEALIAAHPLNPRVHTPAEALERMAREPQRYLPAVVVALART